VLTRLSSHRWVARLEVVVIVAVVGGVVLGALRTGGDLAAFVGRFHPLLVHLPIGFLILTAIVEGLSRSKRYADARRLVPPLLALGALSVLAAIVTGTLLARSGEYDAALVARHQTWGMYLGVVVVLAGVAAWLRSVQETTRATALYGGTFALSLLLMAVTGHFGGSLTHGESFLTEHMPPVPWLTPATASTARGPVDPSSTPVFATLVAPTLQNRCTGCHGPARQAGGLRLDSVEALRKGGEGGPVIVPGQAAASEMVRRIWLPASDKKVMPPKGHPSPTHAEGALLRWWIDQGASFDQVLADVEVPGELEAAVIDRLGPIDFDAPAILAVRVPPGDPNAIEALRQLKLRVEPLRHDTGLLHVQAPPAARALSDTDLTRLAPLASQITWLDLGGTAVTDAGVQALLPKLVNLSRLSLDRTAVTDTALAPLASLQRLETINLYATQVTDAGLEPLGKLPRLTAVYAWQTQITPAGVETLQATHKKLRVNLGAPPEPPAATERAQAASKKSTD
jgi:uncharacterized membrane protein